MSKLWHQQQELGPIPIKKVSGLLPVFIALSLMAHGLSLFFLHQQPQPTYEHQLGAKILHTSLVRASNNIAEPSPSSSTAAKLPQKTQPPIHNIIKHRPETPLPHPTITEAKVSRPAQKAQIVVTQGKQASINPAEKTPNNPDTEQLKQQYNYLLGNLQNRLHRYLTYPTRARKRGWQGQVTVAIHINGQGELNNVRLAQSSGYSLLDRSALTAVSKLEPVSLPDSLGPLRALDLLIPVFYQLREG